jgi:DNA-binding NtrC family response regulator
LAPGPVTFDLVITDETMPGMTGTELARQLMAIRPGLLVILTSGYAGQSGAIKFAATGICANCCSSRTPSKLWGRRATGAGETTPPLTMAHILDR